MYVIQNEYNYLSNYVTQDVWRQKKKREKKGLTKKCTAALNRPFKLFLRHHWTEGSYKKI